jgi:hypothetical protein
MDMLSDVIGGASLGLGGAALPGLTAITGAAGGAVEGFGSSIANQLDEQGSISISQTALDTLAGGLMGTGAGALAKEAGALISAVVTSATIIAGTAVNTVADRSMNGQSIGYGH